MHLGIPEFLFLALILEYCLVLPPILKRYGHQTWMTYIPVLQFIPLVKALQRPWYWVLLLLVPGLNLLMLVIVNVELGIAFNLRSTKDQWLFGALPWYRLAKLAFQEKHISYLGPRDWKRKKGFGREWGEAILFAVIAASVIRSFFLEAFTIPTPSMEKSMRVGDYLFVSKFSYGTKLPETPVSLPFVHNAMPGSMMNSYLDWFTLPYLRLPGLGKVERFDPVVFNFPNGDTILVDPYYAGHDYYGILRNEAINEAGKNFQEYAMNPAKYEAIARKNFAQKHLCVSCGLNTHRPAVKIQGVRYRPNDKKEMYIKRCIGLPGEKIQLKHRQVYINDTAIENPENLMFTYEFQLKNPSIIPRLIEQYDVNNGDFQEKLNENGEPSGTYTCPLTQEEADELKKSGATVWITPQDDTTTFNMATLYPNSTLPEFYHWTVDNYGPVVIPAKGMTIRLTPSNVAMYRRVIDVYENHDLKQVGNQVWIDGVESTSYTFEQDYYWMMGDNRHHSADSRFWGFVPESHVVGKAVFTWFSKEDPAYSRTSKIRWDRVFRFVQ